jgi:hypothetical protein
MSELLESKASHQALLCIQDYGSQCNCRPSSLADVQGGRGVAAASRPHAAGVVPQPFGRLLYRYRLFSNCHMVQVGMVPVAAAAAERVTVVCMPVRGCPSVRCQQLLGVAHHVLRMCGELHKQTVCLDSRLACCAGSSVSGGNLVTYSKPRW